MNGIADLFTEKLPSNIVDITGQQKELRERLLPSAKIEEIKISLISYDNTN